MSERETSMAGAGATSETQAEDTGLPIPADLAARFADMIGEWVVTGTETVLGQTNEVKGRVAFSPVVGGMALLASGKFQSPLGTPGLELVSILTYDRTHKTLWDAGVANAIGPFVMTGTYSSDGFELVIDATSPDGKALKGTSTFVGRIGSCELKRTVTFTIDGEPYVSASQSFIKQK